MGQYWKLINIDKRCALRNFGGVKLGDLLSSGESRQLLPLLTAPRCDGFKVSEVALAAAKGRYLHSRLASLPQEVIDAILDYIPDATDILALALTCGYFFRLLAPVASQALAKDTAPWAGDRLILVGDYADNVPDDAVQDDEIEEWKTSLATSATGEYEEEFFDRNPLYVLGKRIAPVAGNHEIEGAGDDVEDRGLRMDLKE